MGFVNLMRSHPRAVAEHRALVLQCLSDDDVTIRTRALELLSGERENTPEEGSVRSGRKEPPPVPLVPQLLFFYFFLFRVLLYSLIVSVEL